jgi:uncharacterized protein
MRTPQNMPRRLPRASRRLRVGIVIAIVALIVLISSLRGVAGFWTDYLWFQSVGFTSVFRGVLVTKLLLALVFISIFFVLMLANLVIAYRVAPDEVELGGADEIVVRYRDLVSPRNRLVHILTSLIFALLAGVGADREWNNWDLFRYHKSFGIKDPQFHRDIGFYVFQLPFIKFLLGWAFEAMVVIFIVTALAHYLNGGIQLQGAERRVTAAVKTHLSVLLGVLALIKAVDYYYQKLELVLSRSHVVNGATATSVHADKPAKTLLFWIAIIAAALFLANIRQKGWTLPAVSVALWGLVYILVGAVYPAIYQAARVSPSELTREAPYIQDNINATRAAYGLDKVQVENSYNYTPTVTSSEIQGNNPQQSANRQTLANVRLLDPQVSLLNTFDKYQGIRSYYNFNDLNLDRYQLDVNGQMQETATIASVRELNGGGTVPSGFVNTQLQYTHGYGAVLAPISQGGVNADGTPNFALANLPPTSDSGAPTLSDTGAQVYFGEGPDTSGFVIANSKTPELDYGTAAGSVKTNYAGRGGVTAGGFIRRAAFALRFGNLNFLLSGQIKSSSRVMYIRNIVQRVQKAAPFLKLDSDPYSVILNGNIYWVVDAYTTTDNYPYSQNAITDRVTSGGLDSTFNYVRNSVKVVVSAYDGSMKFFVVDPNDPIIQVYEKAFPDLFTPVSMADTLFPGIVSHFRYPEDIFRIQTNMFGRYHLTDASDFYSQAQAWSVSPDPGSGLLNESSSPATVTGTNGQPVAAPTQRLQPQYLLAHLPGQTEQDFMLLTPFVPFSPSTDRQNLTAFLTASSDPEDYGTLRLYETPPGETVDGPGLISNTIRSNQQISAELTLFGQKGSQVELGEVAVVPIDQSLLYVQPVYVEQSGVAVPIPTLRDVVVVYNGQAYHSGNASLDNALCQIQNPDNSKPFASYCNTAAASSVIPSAGTTPTTPVAPGTAQSVKSLLAQAQTEFTAAQAALKAGNLASYQADVNSAESDVAKAYQLAAKPPSKG